MELQLGLFPDEPTRPSETVLGPVGRTAAHLALAAKLPERLRLGTSSWSFPGWAGIVYDRPASERDLARYGLDAYAQHPLLRTVSVDRTYYQPVAAEVLRGYADAVPDHFRFVVKAERALTSPLDPEPFRVRGPNPRFLDPGYAEREVVTPFIEGLGPKAGVLLFQFPPFPPNLVGGRSAFLRRLRAFLAALPEGPTYAVELRSPALLTEAYADTLADAGVAHCYSVHPAMTALADQLARVQPFMQPVLLVRWMLHEGLEYEAARSRYHPFDRLVDPDDASLERIAVAALDALVAERDVYVVANNKAEGSAPLSVFRLAERIARWDGPLELAAAQETG